MLFKHATTLEEYLRNPEAFGTILYRICLDKFGKEFIEWESDTISKELSDVRAPDVNIDKVLSLVSLANSFDGRLNFFNEVHCFRHTVNALNNLEPNYEFLGALMPQHICWAMHEVGLEYPEYSLDEEPAKFTGLSFYHSGFLILPETLSEYQEFLDYFNVNKELVPKIKELWAEKKKTPVDELDSENILDIQVLMLKSNTLYMGYRKQQYANDLTIFNS
jgi:hypothetical protein